MTERDALRLVELRDKFSPMGEIHDCGYEGFMMSIGKDDALSSVHRETLEFVHLCIQLANVLELGRKVDKPSEPLPE